MLSLCHIVSAILDIIQASITHNVTHLYNDSQSNASRKENVKHLGACSWRHDIAFDRNFLYNPEPFMLTVHTHWLLKIKPGVSQLRIVTV